MLILGHYLLFCAGAVVRAQGLWNSREEGKWVALQVSKIHREQGIRLVLTD